MDPDDLDLLRRINPDFGAHHEHCDQYCAGVCTCGLSAARRVVAAVLAEQAALAAIAEAKRK